MRDPSGRPSRSVEAQEDDPVAAAVEASEGGRSNIIIRKACVPGWEGGLQDEWVVG
jgi:hypothetical protein